MAKTITGKNRFNINSLNYELGSLSISTGEVTDYPLDIFEVTNNSLTINSSNDYKGYITPHILIEANQDFTLSFDSTNDNFNVIFACYDVNQHYIGYFNLINTTEHELHIRTPDNCRYYRIALEQHIHDEVIRFTDIMLEPGTERTEYEPYTETIVEVYGSFREDIYQWMKDTLSPNLTKGDLDIIIKLMCYIFGDLDGLTTNIKSQIDPDKADELYLRHLCTTIGYEWNEALTADQQRESIKLFIDIRRRRGTPWSLANLCRVFGQDATSVYSNSNLSGVKVIEYKPDSWTNVNLYNHLLNTSNKLIEETTGNLLDSSTTSVTDFIAVRQLDATFNYLATGLNSSYFGAYYDADQILVDTFSLSNNGTLTVPNDAEYVRFTISNSNLDSFRLERQSVQDTNGLYPGDLIIEVPQFSTILREAIDNIRLIGTRLIFSYMIYVGLFKAYTLGSSFMEIHQFFDPAYWGYDPIIKTWGPQNEDTIINTIKDWQISHRVRSAISNFSCSIYVGYKAPYEKGFIWHEPGNDNYLGFLVDDETLHDEHTMYGMGE